MDFKKEPYHRINWNVFIYILYILYIYIYFKRLDYGSSIF